MKFYYCLAFLFLTLTLKAQNTDSVFRSLSRQLYLTDTVSDADLFLHFDKTIYTASENAWFSAYLMHATNLQDYHTLYVTLINEMEQSVVSSYKFAIDQGLASGSVSLPDSLYSGKYCLLAYTNKNMGKLKARVFRQPIEIIGLRKNPFALKIDGLLKGDNIIFNGKITTTGDISGTPYNLSFTITADGKLYKKFDQPNNKSGELEFVVPRPLALNALEINGKISKGKEQVSFKQALTWSPNQKIINFYPQGGKLLDGQAAHVAFSAKSSSGKGISTGCVLLEDNLEVGSFTTDIRGNGFFVFTPKVSKQYLVKFKGEDEIPTQKFPGINANTLSLNISNTIVNDTLRLSVSSPDSSGGMVVIHDSKTIQYGVYVKPGKKEVQIKVPVNDWEDGLKYVCLFTRDQRLIETRLVLVKSIQNISAELKPDSVLYKPLSHIKVKLKLTNSKGEPIKGIFSFSSALEQAVSSEAKNIEVFNSFERFLPDRALLPPLQFLKNDQDIRSLLLYQENRFPDIPVDSAIFNSSDNYDGEVLFYGKKIKKPVDMMLIGAQTSILRSDNYGKFIIPYLSLRADAGKRILLSVIQKNPSGFEIKMSSPLDKINMVLAKQNLLHSNIIPDELSDEQKQLLASSKSTFLNEVVITGKKPETGEYNGEANSSGVCNDSVCQFDVLNCPYHAGVKRPQEGHEYNFETFSGIIKVTYHCPYKSILSHIVELAATVNPTGFIPFDPLAQNQLDAMKNTTLHWQAMIETDEKGEATVSFRNNARGGRFKAIVQGITTNGVFSAETYFDVR